MKRNELRASGSLVRRAQAWADPVRLKRWATEARPLAQEWLRQMRAKPTVMRPYHAPTTWRGRLLWLAIAPALFVFCFVYGFFFAMTAPYLIVQCALPILVLALLSIWALPDERVAPTRLMHFFFAGFMISICLWPSYLAVELPGLPWITPARLFGIPLGFTLLISLSISRNFRRQLGAILNARPLVWKAFAAFTAMQFITLPLSDNIATSINKILIQQTNWTAIFIFSAYVFSKPGRISRYIALFCAAVPIVFIVGHLEFAQQRSLWYEHVPSFLAADDLAQVLKPEFRMGTGEYRTKSIFSTALGYAQFVAVFCPFYIHYIHISKNIAVKISGICLLVVSYIAIEQSGSRLGLVGMLWSSLLYIFVYVFIHWRRFRNDLLAPAIFYSYPAFFVTVMTASFTISSVHDAIWGGGAQQGSNDARMRQLEMAIPKVLVNPIGYGAGQAGSAMGYADGHFVTIDNYLISVALENGVIGLIGYLTMFIAATSYAFRSAIANLETSRDPEATYLIPLGVAVSAFVIIKVVFSQIDNDPILFAMSGMLVALIGRVDRDRARQARLSVPTPPPRPESPSERRRPGRRS